MSADERPSGASTSASHEEDELIEAALRQEAGPRVARGAVPPLPDRIGPFKITRLVGAGGMGVVYEARQEWPIRRTVALKVIKLGMDTRAVVARFEAERQALAMMDHPNIARVFDAGTTEQGRPYFVMEYVHGLRITEYCDTNRLTVGERLGLFVSVCHAIQHAHQKGVIHRDIKPGNVLVAVHDDDPIPTVIDFGVAKATRQRLTEQTIFTQQGQLVGTPEYMSPEQARADPDAGGDVDTRTDVYSLGVLLYELLVGALPFDPAYLRRHGLSDIQRIICNEEPPKPSTRLSTLDAEGTAEVRHALTLAMPLAGTQTSLRQIAQSRRLDPASLRRRLRGDLDWITMKALEKDRARRYASAADFTADIERHLRHEPVAAGPPGTVYKIRKFVRRNRMFVVGATAVLTALVAGLIGSTLFAIKAKTAERETRRQQYLANIKAAGYALAENEIAVLQSQLEVAPRELRNWEWGYLFAASDQRLAVLHGHTEPVWSVAYSPDGALIASGAADRSVRIWDTTTGRMSTTLRGHDDRVFSVAFDSTGARVASGSQDGTVRIWDLSDRRRPLVLNGHVSGVYSVAFSPDGTRLASGARQPDGKVRLWDAATGAELAVLGSHESHVYAVAFDPSGKHLASASEDGTVLVWDVSSAGLSKSSAPARFGDHDGFVRSLAYSPDGTLLASGAQDETVRIWDASSGTCLHTLRGHRGVVQSVAFRSDGRYLASGADDNTVRVWDALTGTAAGVLRGHAGYVQSVAFSPDGHRLASACRDDRTIRLWDASTADGLPVLRAHASPVVTVVFSPDGTHVASASVDGTVLVSDVLTGGDLWRSHDHEGAVRSLAFSPDSERLASGSDDATVRVWNTATGSGLQVLSEHEGGVTSVLFSPDGARLASASTDQTVRLWGVADGAEHARLAHDGHVYAVVFSPDGRRLASGSDDRTARLWDAFTGRNLVVLREHEYPVIWVAFHPDGTRLATASTDGVRLWDVSASENAILEATYTKHHGPIAFSPDGALLASARNKIVQLWESSTEKGVRELRGHEAPVSCIAFNPDGTRLASATGNPSERGDKTVRIWDTSTGDQLLVLRDCADKITSLAFSPDGTRLVVAGRDGTLALSDSVPHRVRYRQNNARTAADEGRPDEAEQSYRNVLSELRTLLGGDHRGTLTALGGLADSLVAQGKFDEAEPLARECYERNAAAYGQSHVNTVHATRLLADLYRSWGHADEAEKWGRR